MAHLLYYDSPYITEWQTETREIKENEGKYHIALADTAFYPGGGGQPSDRGTIEGIPVIDVYEQDGEVYHVLDSIPEKTAVTCVLDFERRFDYMQQHTGQHLLSATFYNMGLGSTSSLHMGEDIVSVDLSVAEIPEATLMIVEDAVNDQICRDVPIKIHVVTPEEANKFALRRVPPSAGTIRIVEIESVDYSPCCGIHVKRSGELGMVKILRTQKMRGQTRIYFKCGKRALKDYRSKHETITELTRRYSCEDNEVLSRVEAQSEQIRDLFKELSGLKDKMLELEARDMAESATSSVIGRSFEDKNFDDINKLQQHILKNGEYVLVLSSIPDRRLIFAHGGSFDVDCGKILKENLPEYKGKGGGKDKWANAGFNSVDDLLKFQSFLIGLLSSKGLS